MTGQRGKWIRIKPDMMMYIVFMAGYEMIF